LLEIGSCRLYLACLGEGMVAWVPLRTATTAAIMKIVSMIGVEAMK
jgi:hypothetical protein